MRKAFVELAEWYLRARDAGGVVLGIKIPHAIDALKRNRVLDENTLKKVQEAVNDFRKYYEYIKGHVRLYVEEEGLSEEEARRRVLNDILNEENDPIRAGFFNVPIPEHIPPEMITIVEEVPAQEETQEPEKRFLRRLKEIVQRLKKQG